METFEIKSLLEYGLKPFKFNMKSLKIRPEIHETRLKYLTLDLNSLKSRLKPLE